jgi:methionyl-tRNA formyltransferase
MPLKIGYAGDRELSVKVLSFIQTHGISPSVLLVSDSNCNSHAQELVSLCEGINPALIIRGSELQKNLKFIIDLHLDYIICIHFPYIIPEPLLASVKLGVLNLHPALLPYNRGWHTPTWAIIDNTPYGATLHFMDKSLDTGDIIAQKTLEIFPDDTADKLYKRVLELELELFKSAWSIIQDGNPIRITQKNTQGSSHKKEDIKTLQKLELSEKEEIQTLLNRLRGLTTNTIQEAAYFEMNGQRYYVQLKITKENDR